MHEVVKFLNPIFSQDSMVVSHLGREADMLLSHKTSAAPSSVNAVKIQKVRSIKEFISYRNHK